MRNTLMTLLVLALAACSMTPKKEVAVFTPDDIATLVVDVVEYTSAEYPPAASTIWLAIDEGASASTSQLEFAAMLAPALRNRGFAVAVGSAGQGLAAPALVFDAKEVAGGVVALIELDGKLATRWYQRDSSAALSSASPYTVRMRASQ